MQWPHLHDVTLNETDAGMFMTEVVNYIEAKLQLYSTWIESISSYKQFISWDYYFVQAQC